MTGGVVGEGMWTTLTLIGLNLVGLIGPTATVSAEQDLLGQYVEVTTRGVAYPPSKASPRGVGDFAILAWSVSVPGIYPVPARDPPPDRA